MNPETVISIIEDNVPIRKLFKTLLTKGGFKVVDFPDGKSAFEWLKENKVNALIMDILLPDINGTELIKMVRDLPQHENIPIIAITGFATSADRQKFLDIGFSAYIPKPVNVATFVEDVKSIIFS